LKSIGVVRRFNDTEDFDNISEKKMPRVINYITQVIHEYVEKQRPQNKSLLNAREHYKRR
jgi:serine protease inhibitor